MQAALACTDCAPAEDREEADDIPQERIMEQTIDMPVPQETKASNAVSAEPAPAVASRRRTEKRVAPTLAVTFAEPNPVSEYAAPSSTGTCAAPASSIGYAASVPAVTETALSPVNEYGAPAPADTYASRAPVIDYGTRPPAAAHAAPTPAGARAVAREATAPVIEYVDPAPPFILCGTSGSDRACGRACRHQCGTCVCG